MNHPQKEGINLMVTRVEALKFRSLRHVSQPLGPFQILVGPNESGKSAFLDVLAFLADLQRVNLEHAIMGRLQLTIPGRATNPQHLSWIGRSASFQLAVEANIPTTLRQRLQNPHLSTCRYEIAVKTSEPCGIAKETFFLKQESAKSEGVRSEFPSRVSGPERIIIESESDAPSGWRQAVFRNQHSEGASFRSETSTQSFQHHVAYGEAALAHLPEEEELFPVAMWFHRMLTEGVQYIKLSKEALRRGCHTLRSSTLGPDGSNLPHVVDSFMKGCPDRYSCWLMHVREAMPDIERVSTATQPWDSHRYLVVRYRNGLKAPSWLVSEGTLRFLALTILAYLPERTGPYLIEEPENGIHPYDLETLFQSLSSIYDTQVLLATHSAEIVRLVCVDQLLCFSRDAAGCTDVVTGSAHPLLQNSPNAMDLGLLFGSGVLG